MNNKNSKEGPEFHTAGLMNPFEAEKNQFFVLKEWYGETLTDRALSPSYARVIHQSYERPYDR